MALETLLQPVALGASRLAVTEVYLPAAEVSSGVVASWAVMTAGAVALQANIGRFILGFTAVFWLSYFCWIVGSYANLAVNTPADMQKFGVSWSLRLTAEGGFVVALIVGLIIGNFLPGPIA